MNTPVASFNDFYFNLFNVMAFGLTLSILIFFMSWFTAFFKIGYDNLKAHKPPFGEPFSLKIPWPSFIKSFMLISVLSILWIVGGHYYIQKNCPEISHAASSNERLIPQGSISNLQYMLVDSMNSYIDRYNIDTSRQGQIEQQINLCATELRSTVKSDSSGNGIIIRAVIAANLNLLEAKKKLQDCNNSSSTIADLKLQIIDIQRKYDDLYRDYTMLNKIGGGQGYSGSH